MWRAPMPGLLWHEQVQQGQLVHGAELHGQSYLLHDNTTINMTAVHHLQMVRGHASKLQCW